jgi:hypothetical protein
MKLVILMEIGPNDEPLLDLVSSRLTNSNWFSMVGAYGESFKMKGKGDQKYRQCLLLFNSFFAFILTEFIRKFDMEF